MYATAALAKDSLPTDAELQTPVYNYARHQPWLATSGHLTMANLQELHAQGLQRVIDLRHSWEGADIERTWSTAIGLEYYRLSMSAQQLPAGEWMEQVSLLLDQAYIKPTLMHCAMGHRAGIVLALYAHRRGSSVKEALQLARAAGTKPSAMAALRAKLAE